MRRSSKCMCQQIKCKHFVNAHSQTLKGKVYYCKKLISSTGVRHVVKAYGTDEVHKTITSTKNELCHQTESLMYALIDGCPHYKKMCRVYVVLRKLRTI